MSSLSVTSTNLCLRFKFAFVFLNLRLCFEFVFVFWNLCSCFGICVRVFQFVFVFLNLRLCSAPLGHRSTQSKSHLRKI